MKKLKKKQTWTMPSKSTPGKVYTVTQWEDGALSCDCPAWIFKSRDGNVRGCTHVRGVEVALNLAVSEETTFRRMDVSIQKEGNNYKIIAEEVPKKAKRKITLKEG